MTKSFRKIVQIIFFALFIFLVITGKFKIWMILFVSSIILTPFLGRFYCGWLCPINTVMGIETIFKKKFKIKKNSTPKIIRKPIFRYLVLTAFITVLLLTLIGHHKIPVLPILFFIGIGLTLFFDEIIWHKYLCPYGSILNLASKKTVKRLEIDLEKCIKCGKCSRVCPNDAIIKDDKFSIDNEQCLLCFKCSNECPVQAIHYK